ncbi:MAG: MarR family transcriptional regulator [Acidimicrobiaceae bacterium]|nr:MarR family transcriptional regulator [Acidimicrobiaceae bacterium]
MLQRQSPTARADALDLVAATLVSQISRLARLLRGAGPRELSRTEAGLLATLSEGPRRITELAGTEALAQPSVSKLVDKLEGRGLVARERAGDDGRVVVVSISSEGRLRLQSFRGQVQALLRQTLLDLDDEELADFAAAGAALEQLVQMLQRKVNRT